DVVVHRRHVIGNLAGCALLTSRNRVPSRVTQTIRRGQNPAGYLLERCCQSLSALSHRAPRFTDRDSSAMEIIPGIIAHVCKAAVRECESRLDSAGDGSWRC